MVEPNLKFARGLTAIVQSARGAHHAELVPAAAWIEEGHRDFHLGRNDEASSMLKSMATRFGALNATVSTRTIDLAVLVKQRRAPWTLMKLECVLRRTFGTPLPISFTSDATLSPISAVWRALSTKYCPIFCALAPSVSSLT